MLILAHHGGLPFQFCKQLIYENSLRSGIDIVVIMGEEGEVKQVPISEMILYPWPDKPTL